MRYDFALTFAGEDRRYVHRVARALEEDGFSVFYDEDQEADMWGRHLTEHLPDVYNSQARYCIMFISKHYAVKAWPTLERRSALDRAKQQPDLQYVLPVQLDDTRIPGLTGSVAYVDGRRKSPEDVARLAAAKARGTPKARAGEEKLVSKPAVLSAELIDPICEDGNGPHVVESGPATELRLLVKRGDTITGLIREVDNDTFDFEIVDAANLAERLSGEEYEYAVDGEGRGVYALNWEVAAPGPWYLLLAAPRARRHREVELQLQRRRPPRSIADMVEY